MMKTNFDHSRAFFVCISEESPPLSVQIYLIRKMFYLKHFVRFDLYFIFCKIKTTRLTGGFDFTDGLQFSRYCASVKASSPERLRVSLSNIMVR